MDYTPQEVQLLTKTLPGIAAQLRGTLANMHAALSSGDTPDTCILRQSYYRLLRTVTNLTDASLLAEDFPLPKQDMDLVLFIDDLCRQAQPLLEQCGLTLCADLRPRHLVMGFNGTYTARIFWNLLSNAAKFTPAGGRCASPCSSRGARPFCRCPIPAAALLRSFRTRCMTAFSMQAAWTPPPTRSGSGPGSLPLLLPSGQGGSLLLHSTPGQGTCVTVSLPARRCTGAAVAGCCPSHYAGGFQPVMMELSDALPYAGLCPRKIWTDGPTYDISDPRLGGKGYTRKRCMEKKRVSSGHVRRSGQLGGGASIAAAGLRLRRGHAEACTAARWRVPAAPPTMPTMPAAWPIGLGMKFYVFNETERFARDVMDRFVGGILRRAHPQSLHRLQPVPEVRCAAGAGAGPGLRLPGHRPLCPGGLRSGDAGSTGCCGAGTGGRTRAMCSIS